jgi:hypothetical protein
LIHKFQHEISEGRVYAFENLGVAANGGNYKTTRHAYKLNFQFGSKCMPLAGMEIGHSPFTFVPIAEICSGSHDLDYLVGEFMFIYTTVIPSNSFESICNFIGYFHLTLFIDQFF